MGLNCKCGVEPAQHYHNKETGEIEGYITTIGGKGSDVEITEEEEMLLFEQMFKKRKESKPN